MHALITLVLFLAILGIVAGAPLGGLVERDPDLLVIGLVRDAHSHANYVTTALEAGVRGVVPRSAQPEQIVRVIAETCRSRGYVHPDLRPKARPPAFSCPPAPRSCSASPTSASAVW